MISTKQLLKNFSNLLVSSWKSLGPLSESDISGSLKADWLQANWELIVEGFLLPDENLALEPYGDGADCNGASSRVLYPSRLPSHRLICKPLNGLLVYDVLNNEELDTSKDEIIFDRFVCIGEDGWYHDMPPFDKVLGEYSGEAVVLEFSSIDVQLQSIS